jgi:hypothetical protein
MESMPCDWHGCHSVDAIAEALKDPTHPASLYIVHLLKQRTHPSPYLPYGGLPKPLPDMLSAGARMHTLPIAEQATYADMVARAVAHQPGYDMFVMIGGPADLPMDANSAAVGGMAYFALYAADEGVRRCAVDALDAYMAAKRNE